MLAIMLLGGATRAATTGADVAGLNHLIEHGRWSDARERIARELAQPGLGYRERERLLFQRERMARIRLDFNKRRDEVFREAAALLPGLAPAQFDRWEREGGVQHLVMDGVTGYFGRAAGNLFRLHPEARAQLAARGPAPPPVPEARLANVRTILQAQDDAGSPLRCPKRFQVTYTLTVKPGAVPAGETIRAWLPFPHTGGRQTGVRRVSSDPPAWVPSPEGAALSAIYLEKPSQTPAPTRFQVVFEYSTSGFHHPTDPDRISTAALPAAARAHLGERPPHIVFDEPLRALSRAIVGSETHPHRVARRLFSWVHQHIPWAAAREYSTLDSLTRHALEHRQGDCGIQTMLFMSLCRLNGIPARWESGWTTGPDRNMHDWCAIHLAPHGWVPADVSYGLMPGADDRERWFYLGGLDSYRLVVNTDFEQPLYPAKIHWRSEIVDFQRGEAEWRGGNLYFDQWTWDFQVEQIDPQP
ncbi:MAG: transglutaminase domain-containing protein [Verrucomicrobia bacterium]|nr:transglutaminase domain-containing protein [Verrucomicrobiota bacterium]